MAQPIQLNRPTYDPRAELRRRLDAAPDEHAEALLAAYEVLQGLHDRGVLELLRGTLGSSDQVLEIAVDAAKSPQSIRSIRNLVLLSNMIGQIEPERLGQITKTVPHVVNSGPAADPPGLLAILWRILFSKDVRRALWQGTTLLEAIGRGLGNGKPVSTKPHA